MHIWDFMENICNYLPNNKDKRLIKSSIEEGYNYILIDVM